MVYFLNFRSNGVFFKFNSNNRTKFYQKLKSKKIKFIFLIWFNWLLISEIDFHLI